MLRWKYWVKKIYKIRINASLCEKKHFYLFFFCNKNAFYNMHRKSNRNLNPNPKSSNNAIVIFIKTHETSFFKSI